jgi:glycosyltransferase involved in cell wall biosynthesis
VVLLEAAAMKLPIICSNIAGNIDIVMNSNLGLTFNVKDETELYQQINFALNNKSILQQMAFELYNHVKLNYNQNSLWEAILNEYKSTINKL